MSNQKTYDPYETFKKYTEQWEKQLNDMIHLWTNNREFVQFSKAGTDSHAWFLEMFRKNQELLANQWNLPTKTDVANVAKLSIQTEEKLDSLEEQIWKLQDSVDTSNKEIESMVEISSDIIKLTKQLKAELTKAKKELSETKKLRTEVQDLRNEIDNLHSLKEELLVLKDVMKHDSSTEVKPEEEKELVATNTK